MRIVIDARLVITDRLQGSGEMATGRSERVPKAVEVPMRRQAAPMSKNR